MADPNTTAMPEESDEVKKMESGDFSGEDLDAFERPKNMFNVTEMTYEDYVERHYDFMSKMATEKMVQQQMAQMQMMMKQQAGMAHGGYGGFGQGGPGMGVGGVNPYGGGPPPGRPPPGYCNTFQRGECRFGENCRYKHEIPAPGAGPLPGHGWAGAPGALGAPVGPGGGGAQRDPSKPAGYCNAFQKGECKFGDQCRYRHEINPRPYNPDFRNQQPRTNIQPVPGGSTGAFAAAGYGGF